LVSCVPRCYRLHRVAGIRGSARAEP
jgi:hypothetical protein